jgi:hypothetical protein
MRFAFETGDAEKTRVEFYRNPWIGTTWIAADGERVDVVNPTDPSAHFNFRWVRRYTFDVGEVERHEVTIEQERPALLGGLFPNTYRVFVDGRMTEEHHGY